jgi:hypothetical protein
MNRKTDFVWLICVLLAIALCAVLFVCVKQRNMIATLKNDLETLSASRSEPPRAMPA